MFYAVLWRALVWDMRLIDLILSVLEGADAPLSQGEILDRVKRHPSADQCEELHRVRVPLSAIARQLTKYSQGSQPAVRKIGPRKFEIASNDAPPETLISEAEFHPPLVKYARLRFDAYCKTINAVKVNKIRNNKINKWSNPDIVGISPTILKLGGLFRAEVRKLGIFSTKVLQFYSFELKRTINRSNITEAYFQAVSNSSWANYGYLVVGDLSMDESFLANLSRLNHGYGIGVIHLNYKDPEKSEIIVSAREREMADINFMNFLAEINMDFHRIVEVAQSIAAGKDINTDDFDAIMSIHTKI